MLQMRIANSEFKTRDGDVPIIEGYFVVFNRETELMPGIFEEIAPTAFDGQLSGDVRALVNHDTRLVLGRTKSGTLELRADSVGLYGVVTINTKDGDAMNLYERVRRGDVSQCSFGFDPLEEDADYRDDGTAKFTVKRAKLYEISPCTFPAYEDTGVKVRAKQVAEHRDAQKRAQIDKVIKEKLSRWH